MTLLTLRFGLVAMIIAVLFVIVRPPLSKTGGDWAHLAIVGFLIQVVYFGLCYLAFRAGVAAGTVALLVSFQPIIVALVAPTWTAQTIGRNQWIGLILGLIGVAPAMLWLEAMHIEWNWEFTAALGVFLATRKKVV